MGDSPWGRKESDTTERIHFLFHPYLAWQAALVVKNPSAKAGDTEMWIRSLRLEDPLAVGMATHSSVLAWGSLWTQEPGGLQSMRSQKRRI